MSALLSDVRLAVSFLKRSRAFTVTVIVVMALGIGANSAIYAALDQTVIRALPYRDPDRLAMVWEDFSAFGVPRERVSPATFLDWRRATQTFAELAAYGATTANLSASGAPEQVFGQRITSNLIPMLGVPPFIGRNFTPAEEQRNSHFLKVVGRLKPDRDIASARRDMKRIGDELAAAYPATNARVGIAVVPLKEDMLGSSAAALSLLVGGAACVLLIACANVANLQLARASRRRYDVTVRLALGASPRRIITGLLIENVLLSAAGGAVGLLVARWSLPALQRMVPPSVAGFVTIHLDVRAFAFTAIVTAAAGILFGLAPAIQLARLTPAARAVVSPATRRARSGLVVAELAIAFVLAVGAVLLVETLYHLEAVDPGFSSRGILTANLSISLSKYQDPARRRRFYEEVLARARAIPGTLSAGLTSDLPYTSRGNTMSLLIEGQPAPQGVGQDALFRLVSAGYLETIGAHLREGRLLDGRDRDTSPPVVVVNETLAHQFWPAESALGHRIDTGTGDGARRWMTIVGVVDDVRERGLDLAFKAGVYVPFTQTDITFFQPSEIAIRTARAPQAIAGALEAAVHQVDAEQPVSNIRTMDALVGAELADRTQVLQLLGVFAGLALILAALGTYAVLSYIVSQRTREIGLRLAIGAQSQHIVRSMLRYVSSLAAGGVLVGLAGAAASTRFLSALLYGVAPLDAATLGAVAVLLVALALLASYVPTRRAASLDPIAALRED